ncbi:hypothetical protein [Oceanirhabdus seepicola]|uniref:Uncharacterized protein n=1 Tax=Oceanirhabdus seepicola TaxID=2828781 RepID=A0A9J6NX66_9CLOT|nr:hypothetical protein [Oceanirhabdus seepicola]MCM1989050.1 hypothetical protein [Oceanirhabdus seepicola]
MGAEQFDIDNISTDSNKFTFMILVKEITVILTSKLILSRSKSRYAIKAE